MGQRSTDRGTRRGVSRVTQHVPWLTLGCGRVDTRLTKPLIYPRSFHRPYTQPIPPTKGPLTGGDHQMGAGMQVARRLNVRLR